MNQQSSENSYDNPKGAEDYLKFLASSDSDIFATILHETYLNRLGEDFNQNILDVACGPGWLTHKLSQQFSHIEGVDVSRPLLEHARQSFPNLKFTNADLNQPLPYHNQTFDTLIFNMAAHDIKNQIFTFTELGRILKPTGKLMMTIINPYYTYPVGV